MRVPGQAFSNLPFRPCCPESARVKGWQPPPGGSRPPLSYQKPPPPQGYVEFPSEFAPGPEDPAASGVYPPLDKEGGESVCGGGLASGFHLLPFRSFSLPALSLFRRVPSFPPSFPPLRTPHHFQNKGPRLLGWTGFARGSGGGVLLLRGSSKAVLHEFSSWHRPERADLIEKKKREKEKGQRKYPSKPTPLLLPSPFSWRSLGIFWMDPGSREAPRLSLG